MAFKPLRAFCQTIVSVAVAFSHEILASMPILTFLLRERRTKKGKTQKGIIVSFSLHVSTKLTKLQETVINHCFLLPAFYGTVCVQKQKHYKIKRGGGGGGGGGLFFNT